MTSYSKSLEFDAEGGVESCIQLPMPPRGRLERLILKQISGTDVDADFSILNRRGASAVAVDLNVTHSGSVATVGNASGSARITFPVAHELKVGDTFDVKECDISDYNTRHTVVSVTSELIVVTDVSYTSGGTGGLWQTPPFIPLLDPEMYLVYAGAVNSGTTVKEFELNLAYENADNQSEVSRRRTSALWLSITPEGSGDKTWQIAYTAVADALV